MQQNKFGGFLGGVFFSICSSKKGRKKKAFIPGRTFNFDILKY